MGLLLQDLRYSVRKVFHRPILSAVIVLSMAIGIGATTIVYGIIRGAFLDPFIFPEPDRLVFIWADLPNLNSVTEVLSGPEYLEVGELTDVIESRGAAYGETLNLAAGSGPPERVRSELVTPTLFPTLGVQPIVGRWFVPEDVERQSSPAVVLSYRLWQRRFGGDPELVDQTVEMNEIPHTVVGIMPARFRFGRADAWRVMPTAQMQQYNRSQRFLWTATRLKEGVSLEQANASLEVLARRLEEEYGGEVSEYENWRLEVRPMRDYFIGDIKPALFMLLSAAAFVLLIVCINVANLLLARAFAREREIAARLTLGAGRFRVIRLMMTETMVLVVLGGAFGLIFSYWAVGVVGPMIPQEYLPAGFWFGIEGSALALTVAVTVLAGLVVGLLPALQTTKPNLQESLKEGGRGSAGSRRRRWLLSALVVIEVAAALVLLIGLSLILDGFNTLRDRDHGFDPENLTTFHISLPRARFNQPETTARFWDQLLERLEAVPGIEAVGATSMLPLEDYIPPVVQFALQGATGEQAEGANETIVYIATPGFFRATKIPLESGRLFGTQDQTGTQPVAVANETFVRRFLSDREDPVGSQIRMGPPQAPWITIVGVVRDSTQRRVTEQTHPAVFFPHHQALHLGLTWLRFAVRSSLERRSLETAIQQQIAAMEPELPMFEVRKMTEAIENGFGGWRLCVLLLTSFAGIALLLSAIGIYGVISFSVGQRTHEIGVRMAMGARQSKILRMVLAHGLTLSLIGVVAGAILAFYLTRYLATLALEITFAQPLTYGLVTVFLIAVTLVACSIPAWRATRVSPVDALREE